MLRGSLVVVVDAGGDIIVAVGNIAAVIVVSLQEVSSRL